MKRRRIKAYYLFPPLLTLLCLAALLLPGLRALFDYGSLRSLLGILPYILFLLYSFLAIRLNQSVGFFTGVLLITFFSAMQASAAGPLLGLNRTFYTAVYALIIPLCLTLYTLIGEGSILGPRGIFRAWLTVGLPLLAVLLDRVKPSWLAFLLDLELLPLCPFWMAPELALLLLPPAIAFILACGPRRGFFLSFTILWVLVPLYLLINTMLGSGPHARNLDPALGMIFIFLILLYGLYRLYWNRVYLDELTGLQNRRAFDERLGNIGRQFSLVMIDIDYFKRVNDTYGHAEGDNVLRWVAKQIGGEFGSEAYRFGGEEFSVVMAHTSSTETYRRMEALRRNLTRASFFLRLSPRDRNSRKARRRRGAAGKRVRLQLTISAGVAQTTRSLRKADEVLVLADRAMYQAKEQGRNRVIRIN